MVSGAAVSIIESVPLANDPSHESLPLYVPEAVLCVMSAIEPFMVRLQIGVGSPAPPAGKEIAYVNVLPDTVPEAVPFCLFLWQEAQVPVPVPTRTAVPVTVSPRCVNCQVRLSVPG